MENYFVYAIKCTETGKVFIGVSASKNPKFNPIYYYIKMNAEKNFYVSLVESINTYGRQCHNVIKTKYNGTREFCEQKRFNIINKIGDKCLNDVNIPPEKYTCKCGMTLRTYFKEMHDKEHCLGKLDFIGFDLDD